ncbi:MAG: endonuclease/exonuclease/phosphatase family protein [Pirellulales bacterium]
MVTNRVDSPGRHAAASAQPEQGSNSPALGSSRAVWRRFAQAALLVALAVAIVCWQGMQKRPAGAAAGTSLHWPAGTSSLRRDSVIPATRFRVATFNIHRARGADGRYDFDRTARGLGDFDLIGLNEVRGTSLSSDVDQAEMLGERLGMAWLFAPTERRWWRDDFGNGLLCRRADVPWQRIPLPRPSSRSNRNFVWAQLPAADCTVHVLVTHLERGDTSERHLQLQSLGRLFLSLAEPAVLMGDLNSTADDPQLQQLLAEPGVRDALAEKQIVSPRRIDWILVRGLRVVDAGLVESDASDHPLAWAELEIEKIR